VLIVDDEPLLRDIFREWMEREGCSVLTAENGAAAFEMLQAARVDVIVSDVRMPVMDGIALAKAVKAAGEQAGRPRVILITGFSDVAARDAHKLGVETVLQKPVDRKAFLDAVRKAVAAGEPALS
jgi:CheY-like chemotaxis protein